MLGWGRGAVTSQRGQAGDKGLALSLSQRIWEDKINCRNLASVFYLLPISIKGLCFQDIKYLRYLCQCPIGTILLSTFDFS